VKAAVLAAAAVLLGGRAEAYTLEGAEWSVSDLPMQWTFGPECDELGEAETLEVIRVVWQNWEDVDCAYVSFDYIGRGLDLGLGDGGLGFLGDGYNNVSWCDGCLGGAAGALGLAYYEESMGRITECDEYMDDDYSWTTDHVIAAEGALIDAQAVTTQESGHCLGLGHSDVVGASMFPTYQPGAGMQTPDADDIDGLCAIYPMGEGCRADDECRDGTYCNEGVCALSPPGPQGLGWPCRDAPGCESGVCVLWEGEGVCSQDCDFTRPSEGCPGGYLCRDTSCGVGACIEGSAGAGALGAACGDDLDCASGLCAELDGARICALPCDPRNDTCDGHCQPLGDACGACAEGPPLGAIGAPCATGEDCTFGVCVGVDDRYCSKPCDYSGTLDCDPGYVCEDGACRRDGEGTLGTACQDPADCVSGLCSSDGFCTSLCDEEPCPPGFECVPAGSQSVCEPRDGSMPFGRGCSSDEDCRSGICGSGGCTRECGDGFAPCPDGIECVEDDGRQVCDTGDDGPPATSGCACRAGRRASGSADVVHVLAFVVALALRRHRRKC